MLKKIFLGLLLILLGIYCHAGTIDPNTSDSKYLEYAKKFPYIGIILGEQKDHTPFYGSCVAYKDNIVITAAHLFEDYTTLVLIINDKTININKIIVHENFKNNIFGKHDLAICLLSDSMDLDWYPELYEKDNERGALCSISGFGSTGTFLTGVNGHRIEQRAGSNFIDEVNETLMLCSPSIIHKKTELEFLIAPGDSGGGLFIGNRLAGIHSGLIEDIGTKHKAKYGAISAHTRVSVYKEWIQKNVNNLMINNEQK